MKSKINIILVVLLIAALAVIIYQNFIETDVHNHAASSQDTSQLYTCGMHPDILSEEPGNCPICEMKLTPVKNESVKTGEKEVAYWVAPMDANEIYDSPGKSKMGMDLVPVYEDEVSGGSIVSIDPVIQQNMNVRTELIKEKSLRSSLVTNAVVTVDERKEYLISSRIGGWIETLNVNYTGQPVSKRQILLEIYSPELVSAQEEFLTALRYKASMDSSDNISIKGSAEELIKNSKRKLLLLRMSEKEINQLQQTKEVRTYVPVYSPAKGLVLRKDITEGEKIIKGQMLMHVADLSNIWIMADVYEHELGKVELGSDALVIFNSFPESKYIGKVSFIDPVLDPETRTVKVRIELDNPGLKIKPSMLARVEFKGKENKPLPIIPEEALIRTGMKNIAVLALGNGKFKPVEIKLGMYSNGYYEVLDGLEPGNRIVTSAQFLIDSESSLKSALKQFSAPDSNKMSVDDKTETSDMRMDEEHTHKVENEYGIDSPLIRTGIIDVKSLDSNGDGKLFECPMDWNIIGDEYQRCPSCEMKMKEYTLDEIKKNLNEHGYEYK